MDKRRRPRSEDKGRRGTERLLRSRSYPGFSIGILLSVKVILPVNSVFIPLLNEIHRSIVREREGKRGRGREKGRERKSEMTKKRKSKSSSVSFYPSFLPPSRPPLGLTIANENTAWDKQLLSYWSK